MQIEAAVKKVKTTDKHKVLIKHSSITYPKLREMIESL